MESPWQKGQATIDGGGLVGLAVPLVEVGQTPLDVDVVGLEVKHLVHDRHGLAGLALAQVGFGQLQVVAPRLAHQALHGVEVS